MGILANENAISSGGYQISNSLRFQSASTQYLNRTFASSPTTRTKITISVWVKRGVLGANEMIIDGYDNSSALRTSLFFTTSDTLEFDFGGASAFNIVTTQVFRDPSAWYHIVLQVDTTQATAANRCILYVNGSQVTSYSTANYPAQNATHQFLFGNALNWIGTLTGSTYLFDGYLAEMNVIDGQALTPSSFGSTDTTSGQWVAKKYIGTYGTNGFYLPFSNGTSTTTLGADSSGNGNNWTLTNFTRSAGVNDCWMKDVPSGNGSSGGNYAVLNPLAKVGSPTYSNANLTESGTLDRLVKATIGISSGKWYWECIQTAGTNAMFGLATIDSTNSFCGGGTTSWGYYGGAGTKWYNNSGTAYGSSFTTNDVIGVAFDADAGTLVFYKNNTSQGTAFTGLTGSIYTPAAGNGSNTSVFNFGQRSFAYTPPSGFKALCTANLPTATIKQGNKYMDATLYTGNGTSQSIVNAGGFSPDFVWLKSRSSGAQWHILEDTVRGAGTVLFSNSTAADQSYPTSITSFNSNGFSVGSDSTGGWNVSGSTMVAWQWDAGSSTVTNTSGTISSQVRANPTAGVSVVTWTGAGSAATVGHGLGVAPKMFITKRRDTSENWNVYHASIGNTGGLSLNITNGTITNIGYWNNTSPTANTLSIGTYQMTNGATYVGYVFAEIAGFSKFGSYTGNGSADGPFCYTGFLPKFIMTKRTDSISNWVMVDTSRDPYNLAGQSLNANTSGAESTPASSGNPVDILSNGFKSRTSATDVNASGGTYIYMAFASNPFQNSNSR